MATNLVSSIMQFLTPDMVAKIARTLGIDPDVAQKVVSAAVPAILASFAGLAAKPAGAQQLSETLEQQRPDMLSQTTGAIGGPDQKAIADTGTSLLSTLLGGGGLNGLVSAVSNFAGINQSAKDGTRADRSHGRGCARAATTQRGPGRKRPRQSSLLAERSDCCRHAVRPRQYDGRTRYARCS